MRRFPELWAAFRISARGAHGEEKAARGLEVNDCFSVPPTEAITLLRPGPWEDAVRARRRASWRSEQRSLGTHTSQAHPRMTRCRRASAARCSQSPRQALG